MEALVERVAEGAQGVESIGSFHSGCIMHSSGRFSHSSATHVVKTQA
jgi:hypothetical protein